jgi:hypothetical protein
MIVPPIAGEGFAVSAMSRVSGFLPEIYTNATVGFTSADCVEPAGSTVALL